MHLHRYKQQRKTDHSATKNFALERGNELAPSDMLKGIGIAEDIETTETFPKEAVEPKGTTIEEVDDYYFQDPTTIGKLKVLYAYREIP